MSSTDSNPSLDSESKSGLMIRVSIALTILCTAVVSARIYSRAFMLRNFGVDDGLITITQFLALGLNVTTILEAHYGVGRHSWLLSPEDQIRQLQCLFAAIQLYIWSLCFVKISLCFQYRRIFPARWLQQTSLVIIVFACTWNVAQSILVAFACFPLPLIRPFMARGCLDTLTIWYMAAGINIGTDFFVWLMPIPLISSLQLPGRQKILLCLIFGLGLFACAISIVRATTLGITLTGNDPSWYGADAALWSMVEVNCAILCSSLPTIRFLIAKSIPWLGLRSLKSNPLGARYVGVHLSSKSQRRMRAQQVGDEVPLTDQSGCGIDLRRAGASGRTDQTDRRHTPTYTNDH